MIQPLSKSLTQFHQSPVEGSGLRQLVRYLLGLILLMTIAVNSRAADGFREFRFGDSPEQVKKTSAGLCEYSGEVQDTRWLWRSKAECRGYRFKGETLVMLYFFYSEGELAKIHVVSREIPNYFLVRHSSFNYLLPKKPAAKETARSNRNTRDLLQDNVHQLADEYQYVTFFYEGKWEWEYLYQRKGYEQEQQKKISALLEEESEAGVKEWNRFTFNDSLKTIKEKLEGVCSEMTIEQVAGKETLICRNFTFLEKKVVIEFTFSTTGLSLIELKLPNDWYQMLMPLLKKKYGFPYLEVKDNELYFPSIEFPKANVVLTYKRNESNREETWVALKYLKEGFEDSDQVTVSTKKKLGEGGQPKTKTERILDNL